METVTVQQAAKELGQSCSTIRSWMRHQAINIGIADKKEGAEHWHYVIYRTSLDRFKEERGIGNEKGN